MKSLKKIFSIVALCSLCMVLTACPGGDDDDLKPNTSIPVDNTNGGNTSGDNTGGGSTGDNTGGGDISGGGNGGSSNSGIATSFSGNGTQSNPYIISNASELRKLANDVNGGNTYQGKYFKMTSNVTINSNVLKSDGSLSSNNGSFEEWNPIGNSEKNSFCGTFDGNGYSISGIYINRESVDNLGLFGFLSGEVKNLTIKDTYVCGKHKCGGIAGCCVIYTNNPKITNCKNYGTIEGSYRSGGIFGENDGSSCEIDRCINYGAVDGEGQLGGVVGYGNKTTITNCANYGSVGGVFSGKNYAYTIGGIVGSSAEYGGMIIANCVNFGSIVSGVQGQGGICCGTPNSMDNCVNYGTAYYGICNRVSYRKNVANTYYLNIASKGGGSGDTKITSSQCKSMTGAEMQKQIFLDELNKNANALGSNYAKWKYGSDGFPMLDI